MTPLEFKLANNWTKGPVAYRPILKLTLTNGMGRVSCLGLIDSGGDRCFFPASFIKTLGVENEHPIEVAGAGGMIKAIFHTVTIDLVDMTSILPFSIDVGFTESLNDWVFEGLGVGLLGHVGFFDHFKVSLDSVKKQFTVESHS